MTAALLLSGAGRVLAQVEPSASPLASPPIASTPVPTPASTIAPPHKTWAEFMAQPRAQATRRIPYGTEPSQFVELWQPNGLGPHPVVVMIHGGCWTASVGSLGLMDFIAADLQRRGIAVWNIEYRRIGEGGGGYPGTFQDVGQALDLLATYGPAYSLNLKRVVVVGHSAGGHLALWAASRRKLDRSSPLYVSAPLPISAVLDIAGLPDLAADTSTACGAKVITDLVGPASPVHPNIFADTSPADALPLGVPQVVLHGAEDKTVLPAIGQAYATAARAAGDKVDFRTPPGDHMDEISPASDAWAVEVQIIRSLVGPHPAVATR